MKTVLFFASLWLSLALNPAYGQTSPRRTLPQGVRKILSLRQGLSANRSRPSQPYTDKEALTGAHYAETSGDYQSDYTFTYNSDGSVHSESFLDMFQGSVEGNYKYIYTYDPSQYGRVTEKIVQNYDSGAQIWINSNRYLYQYTANNDPAVIIQKIWNGTAWENYERKTFTYNSNNQPVRILVERWIGNQWQNNKQRLFTYDANNRITERLDQVWDDGTSAWYNDQRLTYTYSSGPSVTEMISQEWDTANSQWINRNRKVETFDANGNMISQYRYYWDINQNQWKGDVGHDWTYNANNLVVLHIYSHGPAFDPYMKDSTAYNANNDIELFQRFMHYSGTWDPSSRLQYHYDTNGFMISYVRQFYDSGSSSWTNSWKTELTCDYTYDFSDVIWPLRSMWWFWYHHKPLHLDDYTWDDSTQDWVLYGTETYTYQTLTLDLTNPTTGKPGIFPNPVRDRVYISGNTSGNFLLRIYDLNGRLLKQTAQNGTDLSGLPAGIYPYRIITPTGTGTGKLIKY